MVKQKRLERQLYFPEVQEWMDEDRKAERLSMWLSYPKPFVTEGNADGAVILGVNTFDLTYSLQYLYLFEY